MILPPRSLDLFLFDLAGTVVRDESLVKAAFRTVVDAHGLEADDEWLRARMGVHKQEVFEELLAGQGANLDAAGLADEFAAAAAAVVAGRGVESLPGADHVIEALTGHGIEVGFISGFAGETARMIVAAAGWPADVVVGSDEVARGRPAPDLVLEAMARAGFTDVGRVGVAGDTPRDLQMGANAGCGVIVGVGHGTHTLEELAAYPHSVLLDDLHGLAALLQEGPGHS